MSDFCILSRKYSKKNKKEVSSLLRHTTVVYTKRFAALILSKDKKKKQRKKLSNKLFNKLTRWPRLWICFLKFLSS